MDIVTLIKEGTITFPKLLFQHYKAMQLSDAQFLIILHLLLFQEEGKSFPSIQELESRMCLSASQIMKEMQALISSKLLDLQQDVDQWGKMSEHYDLTPLFTKLVAYVKYSEGKKEKPITVDANLFTAFEQQFGRPLSPREIEYLNQWLDQDEYSESIILAALNEAKIVGKLNFRYIDRILLEWANQNITTIEEARAYSLKFRSKQLEQNEERRKERNFPTYTSN